MTDEAIHQVVGGNDGVDRKSHGECALAGEGLADADNCATIGSDEFDEFLNDFVSPVPFAIHFCGH